MLGNFGRFRKIRFGGGALLVAWVYGFDCWRYGFGVWLRSGFGVWLFVLEIMGKNTKNKNMFRKINERN